LLNFVFTSLFIALYKISASKEQMSEKPSNSSSELAELQPGPSSRCEPLENFYTKELKYVRWKLKTMYGVEIPEEVTPETLGNFPTLNFLSQMRFFYRIFETKL
jgi:hypothetical protein